MKIRLSVAATLLLAASVHGQNSSESANPQKTWTANQVVEEIKARVGMPWMEKTVDTFKAGDPQTHVTGIATTMMATLDVLQRAAANGQNLVITHEPTFYDHQDDVPQLPQGEDDPVLKQKRAFIAEHHLVIWRFHDHQHRMQIDQIELGNVHKLGWEKYQDPANQYLFTIPETTVEKLAAEVSTKLHAAVPRIAGDRRMKVTRVALSPGFAGVRRETGALEMPDVQVLIAGETHEWETVEYLTDAYTEGRAKAMIVLGHVPSEQAGMEEFARWLRTFITGMPIEFVPTADMWATPPNSKTNY
jgi:putative NIF3 family GTP cyclohydrolase 1 type 2